ncbi:hypothetical protein EWF20_07365 [Sulfolobus sp. S-194]|uniref:hypothetical protein n=1 Tax=Sulfolobus sp. S-194 TaxID=2512240 RepID=UPI0014370BD0|nr:hypothetical protein [Sulfolobus sp. S-194]QIW23986.1 hypothetical protein EWF20_07365 [Sulfolobus sp. S-194]
MVSLFKALMMIGFEHVAPRTLQRGNTTIFVYHSMYGLKWVINTQFGSASYYSQKDVLHGLVLRLVISKEELEFLASLGIDYAREELENYERTLKKIEAGGIKAIKEYLSSLERREEGSTNLKNIEMQFRKQVIYPYLERILVETKSRCPICGRLMIETEEFYNHLRSSRYRKIEHEEFFRKIIEEITNLSP